MILVTGGTGFIGRALIRQLVEDGHDVRMLIRPSLDSPAIPKGIPLEVAITGLDDPRGLESALAGVDVIYHLIGAEGRGARADLFEVDIRGTQKIVQAAANVGVDRIFTVSHIGSDRASAYPLLKAKAIAEDSIRKSGLDYTILRSSIVFGEDDHFTTGIARLGHGFPFVFLIPGEADNLIQPIWVEDLVTCMIWALDNDKTRRQVIELGGPEYLTFRQVVEIVLRASGAERRLVVTRPPYLRALTVFLEAVLPRLPVSVFLLDYLATHRTSPLDTVPRVFGLMPVRFTQKLDHLKGVNWGWQFWRSLFRRRKR